MNKTKSYITQEEKINCQKVADAFAGVWEEFDQLVVVDAGKYGFVKLQYFREWEGFDAITSFFESKELFDDLWKEWMETYLYGLAAGTPMEEMYPEEILNCLTKEKQKEIFDKRFYFAEKSEVKHIIDCYKQN